ncbi:hypothetical protein BS78_07G073000 [Paspalum vaginatum]|nr:hypothetical protein BS78_07G073000 [Paspalum vaginatum]
MLIMSQQIQSINYLQPLKHRLPDAFPCHHLPTSTVSSPRLLRNRYVQAINALKDSTNPKLCLTVVCNSQAADLMKELPPTSNAASISYTKGQKAYQRAVLRHSSTKV